MGYGGREKEEGADEGAIQFAARPRRGRLKGFFPFVLYVCERGIEREIEDLNACQGRKERWTKQNPGGDEGDGRC